MQNNTKPRHVNKNLSKRTNPSDKLKHINNKLLTRLENALGNPIPNPEPTLNPQNNPNIKPTTPSDFELPIILPKLPQNLHLQHVLIQLPSDYKFEIYSVGERNHL